MLDPIFRHLPEVEVIVWEGLTTRKFLKGVPNEQGLGEQINKTTYSGQCTLKQIPPRGDV